MQLADADIIENTIRQHGELLEILLLDRTRTTRQKAHNILWATDSYDHHKATSEIMLADITGEHTFLIQPRICKSKAEQQIRTHDKAEVFTPKDIVCQMNQDIDWGLKHWPVTQDTWQAYVKEKRLEITCGEAPFIVGRYNAASGKQVLKLQNRVGFLDRKLQVVSEYCDNLESWLKWARIAFQSSYGYEWQGDSLLIARENLLYTFVDYYNDKFPQQAIDLAKRLSASDLELLKSMAIIISWNLFQMDGLRYVVPMSCRHTAEIINEAPGLLKILGEKDVVKKHTCEGCLRSDPKLHNGKRVKVMDWETGKSIYFYKLAGD